MWNSVSTIESACGRSTPNWFTSPARLRAVKAPREKPKMKIWSPGS